MKVTEGLCSFCDHKVVVLENPSLYLKYVQKTFFADPMILAQVEDTLHKYSVCVVCMYKIIICHKFKQDYEDMQQRKMPGRAASNCCFICHTKLSELFNVDDNPADFQQHIELFWKVVEDHRSLDGCQVCSDCIFSLHTWHETHSILYNKMEIKDETTPGTPNRRRQSKMASPQTAMKKKLTHLKSVKENPAKTGDWNANVVEDKKFYEQIPYVSLTKRQREKLSRSSENKAKRNKVTAEETSVPSSMGTSGRTRISTKKEATELATPTKRAASRTPISTKKAATTSPTPTKRAASRTPISTKKTATTSPTPTKRAASKTPTPTKNVATTSPTLAKRAASKNRTLPKTSTPKNGEQKTGRLRGRKLKSEISEVKFALESALKSTEKPPKVIVKKQLKIKMSKTFTLTKRSQKRTLKSSPKEHVDITCAICDKHFDSVAGYKSHSLWHEKPEEVTIGLVRRELPRRISVADFLSYKELPDVYVKESHDDADTAEAKEEPLPPTDQEEPQATTSQELVEDNIPTVDENTKISDSASASNVSDSASASNVEQRVTEVTENQPVETNQNADIESQLNDLFNEGCEQDPIANVESNENSEELSKDQHEASENEIVTIDDENGEQESVKKEQTEKGNSLDNESIDLLLTEDEDVLGKSVEDVRANDDENAEAEVAQTDNVESIENEEESPEAPHTEEVDDNTQPKDKDNDSNPNESETSNSNNDADQGSHNEPSGEDEPSNADENSTSTGQNEACDNENQLDLQIGLSDFTNGMEKEPDIQNDVFMNGTENDDDSENELSRKRKRSVDEKENLNTSNSSADLKTKRVRFLLNLDDESNLLDAVDTEDLLGKSCSEYCVPDDILQSKV